MPELRQLVIAAEDPSRLAAFYQIVFELEKIDEDSSEKILSDGAFSLALVAAADSERRGLRKMGFDTVRVESMRKKLSHFDLPLSSMTEVGNTPTGIEFELCDPDGIAIGMCRRAFDAAYEKRPNPIRHVALSTPDPKRLADFYRRLFDMREVGMTERSSIFMSDGYCNLALSHARPGEAIGIHHFGFQVQSPEDLRARVESAGGDWGRARSPGIRFAEYRVRDPEGNRIDISEKGWPV